MDSRIIEKITTLYHRKLDGLGIEVLRAPTDVPPTSREAELGYAKVLLSEIEQFVLDDEVEKAKHWLGFVQGVLWLSDIVTLDEIRLHNSGLVED